MRFRSNARALTLSVLAAVVAVGPSAAQEAAEQNIEEIAAYQAWYAASTGGDAAKAVELARAYLEKHPSGEQAGYVRQWLAGAQGNLFNDAVKKKDMAAMVRIGEERLAQDPQDLTFLYWMALNLRQNELLTSSEPPHARQAGDYAARAIALIEAGGQPGGVDAAKWDKDANLAWLHQVRALVAAGGGNTVEALKHYQTSTGLAPRDAAIVARNALGCGAIHKSLYDKAAGEYQALPEADRSPASPSPGAQAVLAKANEHADAAIDCWAQFLGATAGSTAQELRGRIEAGLAALYRYRHPEAPDGYKALVEKHTLGAGQPSGSGPGGAR